MVFCLVFNYLFDCGMVVGVSLFVLFVCLLACLLWDLPGYIMV